MPSPVTEFAIVVVDSSKFVNLTEEVSPEFTIVVVDSSKLANLTEEVSPRKTYFLYTVKHTTVT